MTRSPEETMSAHDYIDVMIVRRCPIVRVGVVVRADYGLRVKVDPGCILRPNDRVAARPGIHDHPAPDAPVRSGTSVILDGMLIRRYTGDIDGLSEGDIIYRVEVS